MFHAVILYSMGSPETLNTKEIKKYLHNFLSDKLVVKLPRFLWQPILHSFILRSRPERITKRYQQILVDGKNPYLLAVQDLATNLSKSLNAPLEETMASILTHLTDLPEPTVKNLNAENGGMLPEYIVRNAFAYTGQGLERTIEQCITDGANRVTILPLFPIYTDTTSRRPYLIAQNMQSKYPNIDIKWCRSYPNEPLFIQGIVNTVHSALQDFAKQKNITIEQDLNTWLKENNGHVLFSYHGLPQSYIALGDPYLKEVKMTTDSIVESLHLDKELYSVAYQSRLGPMAWLKPYLEKEVDNILQKNKSTLLVIAPNFTISCLENLHELNIMTKDYYLNHGGENFIMAKSMDGNADHVQLLTHLIAMAKPLNEKQA